MMTMQKTCGNCCGFGYLGRWEEDGDRTLRYKTDECKRCDGKGYVEYATFTIEEAKAILKHCGLDKE